MYKAVQKGKLTFKSGKKKKKKKRKSEKELQVSQTLKKKKKDLDVKDDGKAKDDSKDVINDASATLEMTESERNFLRAQARLREKRINKKIEKTHREKIKEFNNYLGSLSEHYDIPRVGPG
mmetsp:Transcript_10608/g.15827  ORF Transcript_10608/g.15827 Transcript_10608/m.15827 type:complete len:121 (-) Transcript_10608:98-460(-)|eukprot:CAMPEP_0167743628 /NCGR_PEP_ID=MMETSP0110_2-20121227/2121_1 /TAXON_ID=629695 /ORGANISM="Gymnochlora sp., Strain CCMP2014" /LENGTH=120 /DNA_ID=CAMNT_0007628019 /DNA_START=673 /DNA_END=1035 /DNA_ORIENTATION=-